VPLLGNLPLIGGLFRQQSEQRKKRELVILLLKYTAQRQRLPIPDRDLSFNLLFINREHLAIAGPGISGNGRIQLNIHISQNMPGRSIRTGDSEVLSIDTLNSILVAPLLPADTSYGISVPCLIEAVC
jgi:hypothetical protein